MSLQTTSVTDWMHADVPTLAPEGPVRAALDGALDSPVGCVVVVDERRRVRGIVTEGDVIRRVLSEEVPGGAFLRSVLSSPDAVLRYLRDAERSHGGTVADLMTEPVVTLNASATMMQAAQLFHTRALRQVPIVDANGALVGLLNRRDIVRAIFEQHDEAERQLDGEHGT
ncbi:MAG: CBS domain-containing protein [Chloroflexi bacterium]|nr:CBS domain-containing protein [Chloroflexota bacterium]